MFRHVSICIYNYYLDIFIFIYRDIFRLFCVCHVYLLVVPNKMLDGKIKPLIKTMTQMAAVAA